MEPLPQTLPVEMVKVESLKCDPATYQFRMHCDANGVTEKGRIDAPRWDPILHGSPLLIHKRANGDMFVADGHHRLEFAKRVGVAEVPAQVLDEAKGFSTERVKLIAAEKNLAKGHASAVDAARVLKEEKKHGFERDMLTSWQPDTITVTLLGLSDKALDMVEAKKIPVAAAAFVAQSVADPARQENVLRHITMKLAGDTYPRPVFAAAAETPMAIANDNPAQIRAQALQANQEAAGFVKKLQATRAAVTERLR